jgi:cobalamin biosynthesis Mg chelatase CobN
MKYFKIYAMMLAMAAATVACSSGSDIDDALDDSTEDSSSSSSSGSSSSSSTTTNSDLSSLTVAIDSTDLSETETVPSDDEDYVENYSASSTIYINYNGTSASYSGSVSGVTVSISFCVVML